ncbi:hypothetical protein SLEP1_g23115 [Rubroshorea leprosula]|uniref:GIY-YIG homing endonuclease n=1 Tax=Rubroshorea leprosula TaxID=152421 RepID=A0AAV5JK58_9ROSI|nr:hypothetical protein SLEP1_g23115 [Rubroshorea leprosula]
MGAATEQRFKREDRSRIRHGPHFSNWQVLIGPNDWEDYSEGKEGVARYRLHNLPKCSSPGLYELGVAVYPSELGRDIGKLKSKKIVVVYVGQADDVRTRLQQYGRSGAHLGRIGCPQNQNGDCGYFADIFSKGYSIVFRWVPFKNKADAQRTEAEILNRFDYAWNKGCNGSRRPEDILKKLDEVASGRSSLLTNIVKILPCHQKLEGIKIKTSKPLSLDHEFNTYADEKIYNFLSQILKFSRSQPRLVTSESDTNKDDTVICGVILSNGSICSSSPVEGRKRCAEHKGMKTKELILTRNTGTKSQMCNACSESIALSDTESDGCGEQSSIFNPTNLPLALGDYPESKVSSHPICGFIFDDGSPCIRHPTKGRKRCDEHKGRKIGDSKSRAATDRKLQYVNDAVSESSINEKTSEICIPEHVVNESCDAICGVELGNGFVCMRQPVRGRIRCEEHRGLKITGLVSNLTATNKPRVSDMGSECSGIYDPNYSSTTICGATTCNGSLCSRSVKGKIRCWQHSVATNKSYVSDMESKCSATYDQNYSHNSICGATTRNGSLCSRPVTGNRRCWQHCVAMNKSYVSYIESKCSATYDHNYNSTSSICGATTRNGSLCRRPVKGNRRCWQH